MKKETYVIIADLPDANEGTIVKWCNEKKLYYYFNKKIDTPVYLSEEQVKNNQHFFIKYNKYPEYYGYENPVLSRKDIVNLLEKYVSTSNPDGHRFKEELKELTKSKAEEILKNQKTKLSNLKQDNNINKLGDALKVLIKHLIEDDRYKENWISNITVSMYDTILSENDKPTISLCNNNVNKNGKFEINTSVLKNLCRKGAENFINLFITATDYIYK